MGNLSGMGLVVARTLVLFVALANQVLAMFGIGVINLAVNEADLANALTLLFTVVASVWAWWKNNSFTKAAKKADEILKLEKGKVSK
ncbi:phage holin [Listeria fleischmannii]|uniref:Prophage L54a, holin, SPP1 family protein n=1 Tax=Listeria fleischmannii FSL S10-1203 TaxID=1265822 RepID=W7DNC3_9LIST|nr:phage holin [Listeria fleischmannii]EUJ56615.1 prophage L54a, holin, SPP1 family protein [Listeria fleischmannii FSL S10-1203]